MQVPSSNRDQFTLFLLPSLISSSCLQWWHECENRLTGFMIQWESKQIQDNIYTSLHLVWDRYRDGKGAQGSWSGLQPKLYQRDTSPSLRTIGQDNPQHSLRSPRSCDSMIGGKRKNRNSWQGKEWKENERWGQIFIKHNYLPEKMVNIYTRYVVGLSQASHYPHFTDE